MKLCVVIPAFREAETIRDVIGQIPKTIPGIADITILVVDDGSPDHTASVALSAGADKIITHSHNLGLAEALNSGLEASLKLGADLIVHLDADGQYDPQEIPKVIQPILDHKADLVLGSRFAGSIEYMPFLKRIGNRWFTSVIHVLTGVSLTDAQTGFRALSREAASQLYFLSSYTYTQAMIIQAANKRLNIVEVPCTFRVRRHGNSRLVKNVWSYGVKCLVIVLQTYKDYKPLQFFGSIGLCFFSAGIGCGFYILSHFLSTGKVSPHIPLTILTGLLVLFGIHIILFAFLADMLANARRISEKALYEIRQLPRR